MRLSFFFFAMMSSLGFTLGWLGGFAPSRLEPSAFTQNLSVRAIANDSTENTRSSGLTETVDINNYDRLPCPPPEVAERLAREAKLKLPAEMSLTCDDPKVSKILKLFWLAQRLQVTLPPHWGGTHRESLLNTWDYIATKTPQGIELDLHQQGVIASNFARQKIYIGSLFFEIPPIESLQVLVHENRHSSLFDKGHVRCITGDIPQSDGACDEEFSIDHTAGAYAYGYMFGLGLSLYGKNISPENREQLFDFAINGITSRFNRVPESLAVPLDLLYVLLDDNRVYQVHPFTFELIPVDIENALGNQRVVKMRYETLNHGALLFTDHGKMIDFTARKQVIPYYDDLLPESFFAVDSTKLYLSAGDYAYTFFLNNKNELFMKDVDVQTGAATLERYRFHPSFEVKKMFTGNTGSYLLSEKGSVHRIVSLSKGPAPERFPEVPLFHVNGQTWVDATGGAAYDSLIAVSSNGLLYFEGFDGSGARGPLPSDFRPDAKLATFQEGLNIKVGLTTEGKIAVWDYLRSEKKPWLLPLQNVRGFALGRSYALADFLNPPSKDHTAWATQCQVSQVRADPWTGRAMGLNQDGFLVFEGADDATDIKSLCQRYTNMLPVRDDFLEISGSEPVRELKNFSQTFIGLKKQDGETLKVRPYRVKIYEESFPYLPY